ncbi:MAG: hypothetical protein GX025_01465 [Clostridiales bacterium]|nr:hypothetical protein [Clostridiales bacterium]
MKLIIAITSKSDAHLVAGKAAYPCTITDSYSGFSYQENTMIFSGADNPKINAATKIIDKNIKDFVVDLTSALPCGNFKLPQSIKIDSSAVFIPPIDRMIRL